MKRKKTQEGEGRKKGWNVAMRIKGRKKTDNLMAKYIGFAYLSHTPRERERERQVSVM